MVLAPEFVDGAGTDGIAEEVEILGQASVV
jgi:hypothetical protein